MPVAKVGEINLCYEVHGKGQPLILITGFASAQNTWIMQVRAFSKQYRVITFDNRGFGKSDKPPGPYTTKMMAGDTIALMDHLGTKKAHILGGSMGGMAAQEIAIEHPERLDKLVLSSTSAGGQPLQDVFFGMIEAATPGWNRSRPDLASADLQKFMAAVASRSFNGMLYQLLIMPLVKLQAALGRVKVPVGQLEAMLSHNAVERLDSIQAPTLVLTGSQDRLMPPNSSKELASRIKGAKLVVIEGGAHALGGQRFNKEVLSFLKGQ
ncbi:MAG: alpha/beta hydrolase [Dehalococcoidia bacterium]|nr:alpha/beta hydrolase [Dehalococcoidia bacterium]